MVKKWIKHPWQYTVLKVKPRSRSDKLTRSAKVCIFTWKTNFWKLASQALCNLSESRKLALNNKYCVIKYYAQKVDPLFCFWDNIIETLFSFIYNQLLALTSMLYFFLVVRLYCSVLVHPDRARVSKAVCLYVLICYYSVCLHCISHSWYNYIITHCTAILDPLIRKVQTFPRSGDTNLWLPVHEQSTLNCRLDYKYCLIQKPTKSLI